MPFHHAQHAQREGNVGGHRHAPGMLTRSAVIYGEIQEGRGHHAAQRAEYRQCGPTDVRQFAVDDLVLDLHADEEEEDSHERVVDPLPCTGSRSRESDSSISQTWS